MATKHDLPPQYKPFDVPPAPRVERLPAEPPPPPDPPPAKAQRENERPVDPFLRRS